MQKKDDKVGNKSPIKKEKKGKRERERERDRNRFAKKSKSKFWLSRLREKQKAV